MPTYRYQCSKCGEELERFQSFSDKPLTRHSGCGGKLSKVFGAPGIVLKGPGFYRTDNRSGSRSRGSNGSSVSSGSESSSGPGADTGSSTGSGTSGNGKAASKDKPAPAGDSGK